MTRTWGSAKTQVHAGVVWRRTIGAWVAKIGHTMWRAERQPHGFPWRVYNKTDAYQGSTLKEVSQQIISDSCPCDHESHGPECLDLLTEDMRQR